MNFPSALYSCLLSAFVGALPTAQSSPVPTEKAPEVTVPAFPNSTCPIMGKPISAKLFVDTELGRIYMCCKGCTSKIQKDVATAYKAAYPTTTKVGNKTCPITGKTLDATAPNVTVQGRAISVCCEDCVKKTPSLTQMMLVKATNPKVVDVGNEICPITGDPAQSNVVCLVGDHLIRLSKLDCVDQVKADPAGTLAKALAKAKK